MLSQARGLTTTLFMFLHFRRALSTVAKFLDSFEGCDRNLSCGAGRLRVGMLLVDAASKTTARCWYGGDLQRPDCGVESETLLSYCQQFTSYYVIVLGRIL